MIRFESRALLPRRNCDSALGGRPLRSAASLALLAVALVAVPQAAAEMSILDNGVIRLGVDLGKGGTITYLSTSIVISGLGAVNVINSHDLRSRSAAIISIRTRQPRWAE